MWGLRVTPLCGSCCFSPLLGPHMAQGPLFNGLINSLRSTRCIWHVFFNLLGAFQLYCFG